MTRSYRVVPFVGFQIGRPYAVEATDFHICDERGRTARVVPHDGVNSLGLRRRRAERIARRLNGGLATLRARHGRWRIECHSCGSSALGRNTTVRRPVRPC